MRQRGTAARRIVLWALAGLLPALAPAPAQARWDDPAQVEVQVAKAGGWATLATWELGMDPERQRLMLPARRQTTRLRLVAAGGASLELDRALLGGLPPVEVAGALEQGQKALAKVARLDRDLLHARDGRVELTFAAEAGLRRLDITARTSPAQMPDLPFQFPLDNTYHALSEDTQTYAYRLGSRPGQLTVDGLLSDEDLGQPLFEALTVPGTGHPVASTLGWVRDDGQTLYAAIDFLPDNTLDGGKDYAQVNVSTPAGWRSFRVSVPQQRWGRAGFSYTTRVAYQHKTYEFAIPLAELGLADTSPGETLRISFSAYGTVAPDQSVPDQFVPDKAIPDRAVPDRAAAPDHTNPEARVPDKALPDTASKKDTGASPPATEDGCDCSVQSAPDAASPSLLAGLLLALLWGIRRRRG